MVFSSPIFLFLFLPIVFAAYFAAGRKFHNVLLIIASLIFYAWGETIYVLIMVFSILLNYVLAILIQQGHDRGLDSRAKAFLIIAVIANLCLLCHFKYANFLVDNLNSMFSFVGLGWLQISLSTVHLPIGISFFTFQALSYVIDVYRKAATAQRKLIDVALFISFFPQLIAGPILRYHDIAAQIEKRSITLDKFSYGIQRFIMGLGKKVLIANTLAVAADQIFAISSGQLTTGLAWLGITCYTLQIYFDFSGYSDMAIGMGRMFGFEILENFNYPYISTSIRDFWRRWHISLTNWFRDYLYIPLGGNRGTPARTYLNLLIVFFLCGLWHGASWTFVVWGLYHGTFLILERLRFGKFVNSMWRPFRHLYTILVFMIGWVFFRADTLPYALEYVKAMSGFAAGDGIQYFAAMYLNREIMVAMVIGIMLSAPIFPWLKRIRNSMAENWGNKIAFTTFAVNAGSSLINILFLGILLGVCALYLASGSYNPFIYFRF